VNTPIGGKLFQDILRQVAKFCQNWPRIETLGDGKKEKITRVKYNSIPLSLKRSRATVINETKNIICVCLLVATKRFGLCWAVLCCFCHVCHQVANLGLFRNMFHVCRHRYYYMLIHVPLVTRVCWSMSNRQSSNYSGSDAAVPVMMSVTTLHNKHFGTSKYELQQKRRVNAYHGQQQ